MTSREALIKVVDAYKIAKGYEKTSLKWKAWDKANFGRAAKAAKSILEAFDNNVEKAVFFVLARAEEWDEKGLSWTLETISRHAWDDGGKFDGHKSKPLDADRLLGSSEPARITSTGDLAKFVLERHEERDEAKSLCTTGIG